MAAVVSGHGSLKDKRSVRPMRTEFVTALEETSNRINDPVAKLRYLRGSIAQYEERAARGLERGNPRRFGFAALAAALAVAGTSAFVAAGYYFSRPAPPAPVVRATPMPVAEALPALPAGVAPARVWLVEKSEASEQYSNGLRIDTSYEVPGDPRRFRVFEAGRGMRDEVLTAPVGILFHTSESDIWPLDESYNENLRTSSQNLLRYLQRNRVYNYLIDRFGRVFRVVTDESKANHAGYSVWTRGNEVFLSLNHSFLGLSFETRWEGGRALPITAAQLAAGRNLTDWLRQKFEIAPDMCVGHGLVSVNAKKHLIGHHVDWARGFPFEAFGLPDQYAREAPHVALFGFGYDDDFIKVMGEPWPGVRDAERALEAAAARSGKPMDDVRRERRGLFDRWVAEQTKDQEAAAGRRAAEGRAAAGAVPTRSGDAASRPDASYNGQLGPQALRSGG
jgi:hypothetical protein